jgi:hypothetical protein
MPGRGEHDPDSGRTLPVARAARIMRGMRFAFVPGALVASSLLAGCNVGTDKLMKGSLNMETFDYHCSLTDSLEDPYCDAQFDSPAFPAHIALGASFFIDVQDSGGPHSGTTTADPSRIAVAPGSSGLFTTFTALEPGVTSLVYIDDAHHGSDYIDVDVEPPDGLQINQVTVLASQVTATQGVVAGALSFSGTSMALRAIPIDAQGRVLAGTLPTPYTWTTSDPNVLPITGGVHSHVVEIAPGTAGISMLTANVGNLSFMLEVTVQ